jgi:hypothetical protein
MWGSDENKYDTARRKEKKSDEGIKKYWEV